MIFYNGEKCNTDDRCSFDRGNKGYVTVDEAHRPVGA